MQRLVRLILDVIYDKRFRAILYQAIVSVAVLFFAVSAFRIISHNLAEQHIATGFAYLNREAGFLISQSFIEYQPSDSYGRALLVGLVNTLSVSLLGLILATVLGCLVGVAQLASNPILGLLARVYVETLRNVPLLLCLFFWYALFLTQLPPPREAWEIFPYTYVSNGGLSIPFLDWTDVHTAVLLSCLVGVGLSFLFRRLYKLRTGKNSNIWLIALLGPPVLALTILQPDFVINFPEKAKFRIVGGMRLTTEFTALLVGISLSTSATIAEIVRAGILAVQAGQRDAALALGLNRPQMISLVILPQALRLITPPLTGAYLSLFKSSSLAVAIGYPDLVMVSNITMNQTGQAIECIVIYMSIYLILSLGIALFMSRFGEGTLK